MSLLPDLQVSEIFHGPTSVGFPPTTYPGTITADPSGCPNLVQFYFNTRGAPTDSAGNPLTNGGTIIYVTNQNGMVDALTLSVGGRASVWNWDPSGSQWYLR